MNNVPKNKFAVQQTGAKRDAKENLGGNARQRSETESRLISLPFGNITNSRLN
jgi:hypothetical protein